MHFDDVDLSIGDLDELVFRQLAMATWAKAEDRTGLDWLNRAWSYATDHDPATADRIARGIANSLGRGSDVVDSLVCRFFSDRPMAPGGERLVQRVLSALDAYPPGAPDPVEGGIARDLRGALLKAALQWRPDRPAEPELLAIARREIRTVGRGGFALFNPLWKRDPHWVRAHIEEIVASDPWASDTLFTALRYSTPGMREAVDEFLAFGVRFEKKTIVRQIERWSIDKSIVPELVERIKASPLGY